MKQIYLDNAATSFPKAPGVVENMVYFLNEAGCNINRGVYDLSLKVENTVYETCLLYTSGSHHSIMF